MFLLEMFEKKKEPSWIVLYLERIKQTTDNQGWLVYIFIFLNFQGTLKWESG